MIMAIRKKTAKPAAKKTAKPAAAKKPRVTAKSIICDGLLKGSTVAAILKKVAKKIPDSRADESHVRFYICQLYNSGEMNETLKAKYAKKRGAPAKAAKAKAKAKAKPAKAKAKAKAKPVAKAKAKKVVKKASKK